MKKFAIILAALFAFIFALTALWKPEVTVERSIVITASASTVAAQLDDLHAWERWSPWAQKDPAMKLVYAGPARGVGASAQWSGNEEVGAGTMTITEVKPDERVALTVEYTTPRAAPAQTEFTLLTAGPRTQVTWKVTNHNDFAGKFFNLVMNLNVLVGRDLDSGLASLKALAEAEEARKLAPPPEPVPAPASDAVDAGPANP